MKQENSVELQGMLRSCEVSPFVQDGNRFVRMHLVTLHPVPESERIGAMPSDAYTKMHHFIRMSVPDGGQGRFVELQDLLGKEKSAGKQEMHPVRVKGTLGVDGERVFVACTPDGFSEEEKVLSGKNNKVLLTGVIKSVGNRENARVKVSLPDGSELPAFISKTVAPDAWAKFRNGKVKPGDTVLIQGPLVGDRVSDGKTSRYETFLNISSVKGVKLDKKMATGVSL